MKTALVVSPWRASYDPALRVDAGEPLSPGDTDPENPGWRWCVNGDGLGGWLPEGWVRDGRAKDAFDTRELTVRGGEEVDVLARHAGWSRCRLPGGREGWLPDTCLAAPQS